MKGILALLAVFAVALVCSAQEQKKCGKADDCSETECCVMEQLGHFRKGICKNLSEEGEDCKHEDERIEIFGGKFIKNCPCKPGLKCVGRIEESPIFGEVVVDSKCQIPEEP
ncbi:dickkopf-related protein 4-like [Uloborus diversus]|uniref:dickkopf-related protein 4-like n=1 Tax=Uloborus diversus TaxID=327109 RepID=UPI0024094192|nr:dickkopf-related protein 4-like [Uloborus diversus]